MVKLIILFYKCLNFNTVLSADVFTKVIPNIFSCLK